MLSLVIMTAEENIRALSRRVTDAPENSKEFRAVMERLPANLKERAARGREQLAEFQKALRTPVQYLPSKSLKFVNARD